MQKKINYVMFYTENVKDIIRDKLTLIINKTLLESKIKLILCIPESYDVNSINKYREVYDELTICRFAPDKPQFWNYRNIYKYIHYCMSFDLSENDFNFFIDQKTVVTEVPNKPDTDIIIKNICIHEELTDSYLAIAQLLNKNNYPYQITENFICYNFSCCYFNNKVKSFLLVKLNELLECLKNEHIYIREIEKNILLTIMLQNTDFIIHNMNIKDKQIDENLTQTMYLLI